MCIAGYYNEDTVVGRYLKSLKQSYEQFGGAAQAKMTRSLPLIPLFIISFSLFQPRAREEEVSAGEGSEGREAVDGVCESAPDGDQQQCDNCQHVTGGNTGVELSMIVTVTELI